VPNILDARGRRLRAALAAVVVRAEAPELQILHRWLDTWAGIGLIVGGMQRLGYEAECRQFPQGWRVNVRRAGGDPVIGSGWATMPWQAVQMAAWEAVQATTVMGARAEHA